MKNANKRMFEFLEDKDPYDGVRKAIKELTINTDYKAKQREKRRNIVRI